MTDMPTRILALTDAGCEVSTRYRVAQFERPFRAANVELEICSWPRDLAAQSALLATAARADAVVLQRILPKLDMLRRLRQQARRLIYDFDDAIIYTQSTHGRPRLKLGRWWRFRRLMRSCDVITAGSSHLADLARKQGGQNRVQILPTLLELKRYDLEIPHPPPTPILGWIGGRWTLPYLESLRGPLEQLSDEIPGLKLHVIADQRPELGRVHVELLPWSAATEVRDLKHLTIGLAPLPDDAWCRGKCGLRLLQYLAAGIPSVTSPVGTQKEIIQAGAALSATTKTEWFLTVRKLLQDPGHAAQLAQRGRELVRDYYNVAAWANRARTMWAGESKSAPV